MCSRANTIYREKIALGHRRAFTTPAFLRLTSSLPTYMVIEDHEISDNWSRDLLVDAEAEKLFYTARASFSAHQWAHGPRNVQAPGFNYRFREGDCDFFVLDTRTQRRRFVDPQVCDPAQLLAVEAWLRRCMKDARPKFLISGSVMFPGLTRHDTGVPGLSDISSDTWQMAQHQRREVLELIVRHKVRNVVFVSGDFHCAATAELGIGSELNAYAIVTPPLYAQLPAANTQPWEVMPTESLSLPDGTVSARAVPGDGFAHVRALPLATGTWRLEVEMHCVDTAGKVPQHHAAVRAFTLS